MELADQSVRYQGLPGVRGWLHLSSQAIGGNSIHCACAGGDLS